MANTPGTKYESQAIAIEHYHREFVGSAIRGASVIKLDDLTNINFGTELFLGPSNFGGFEDIEESIIVTGLNRTTNEVSFSKQGGLDSSYSSSDSVDFSNAIWVFNDHAFSGDSEGDARGALLRFEYPRKALGRIDTGRKYYGVRAADFDQTRISFTKGPMMMVINIASSFVMESSFSINLMEANLHTLLEIHDLVSDLDNNLYYKLQQKFTTEDLGTGIYTTLDHSPDYNFETQANLPSVKSVALRFQPTRFSITGDSPKSRGFTIFAEVRDQFNFPVLGEDVQFTSTVSNLGDPGVPGTITPSIDTTNVSGVASSVYTPSDTTDELLMDIKAEVIS